MVIVDSIEKFKECKNNIKENNIIIIPIFMSTLLHPAKNGLSLLYLYDIKTDGKYVIPICHPDISYVQ